MIKMKKQNIIPIIALLALVSMMIVPVSATPSYTIVGSDIIGTDNFTAGGYSVTQSQSGSRTADLTGMTINSSSFYIKVFAAESTTGTSSILLNDQWVSFVYPNINNGANLLSHSASVSFNRTDAAGTDLLQNLGSGTLTLSALGNSSAKYGIMTQYAGIYNIELSFDSWNPTGLTGTNYFKLITSDINMRSAKIGFSKVNSFSVPAFVPFMAFSYADATGEPFCLKSTGSYPTTTLLTYIKNSGNFQNDIRGVYHGDTRRINLDIYRYNYTLTGKTGYSNVTIYDGTGFVLNNMSGYNNISIVSYNPPINVSIRDVASGITRFSDWFTQLTPPVTPTPTPTIPAGYVRNNLYIWDQNDAQISGADVDVRDVENASWTNKTADADGWITIDTLPYHTVNVYAHYPTAGIYLPNEILGLETGYYGGHNWVLVLYPYVTTPSGFVTLYINTRNYDTKAVLTGVNLQIKNLVTGAITGESTGSTDSVSTVVTNATNYQITGSKSGYLSKTININSGEASSKTVVVELSKATVTTAPTSTIPPGGVTPVITQDPNDPSLHGGDTSLKAGEMMNWLAMNGMNLVQLCFLVTVLALLGVKLGK
jgi:hypothetical protein